MNKFIITFIVFSYSGFALAGNATGRITSIYVADNSYSALFMMDAPINDIPSCNEAKRFSIGLGKPGGMAAYMAILEAKKSGYQIHVEGLNACANEWHSEDIKNITLW